MSNHYKILDEVSVVCDSVLRGGKISYTTEADLHGVLAKRIGDKYTHEYQLSKGCRLDFFNPDSGLVIEVKIKRWVERDLFYQIERYTKHDEVLGCLLIAPVFTGKVPQIINGVPVVCFSIFNLRF